MLIPALNRNSRVIKRSRNSVFTRETDGVAIEIRINPIRPEEREREREREDNTNWKLCLFYYQWKILWNIQRAIIMIHQFSNAYTHFYRCESTWLVRRLTSTLQSRSSRWETARVSHWHFNRDCSHSNRSFFFPFFLFFFFFFDRTPRNFERSIEGFCS